MTTPDSLHGWRTAEGLSAETIQCSDGGRGRVRGDCEDDLTIAEVFYILIGIAIGLLILGVGSSAGQTITAAVVSVAVCGLFDCRIYLCPTARALCFDAGNHEKAGNADPGSRSARGTPTLDRPDHSEFLQPASWDFCPLDRGVLFRLAGRIVRSICDHLFPRRFRQPVVGHLDGRLAALIKGGTFFIPGSLGAQDAGNLLLLQAFGYSDVTGITFALLRRFREVVWIGIGLLCLALVGKGRRPRGQEGESPS